MSSFLDFILILVLSFQAFSFSFSVQSPFYVLVIFYFIYVYSLGLFPFIFFCILDPKAHCCLPCHFKCPFLVARFALRQAFYSLRVGNN